jgi:hypothetical protein
MNPWSTGRIDAFETPPAGEFKAGGTFILYGTGRKGRGMTVEHEAPAWAEALLAIDAECRRQITVEGYTAEHDGHHHTSDWIVLLTRYVGRVGDAAGAQDAETYRTRLVQVAALATKAIVSLDSAFRTPDVGDHPDPFEHGP